MPISHTLFQKTEEEETIPYMPWEASTALMPKPVKDVIEKKKTKGKITGQYSHVDTKSLIKQRQIKSNTVCCYIITKWELSQKCKIDLHLKSSQCNPLY